MRKSCLCCVKKHICKSIILLAEAELGYPLHFYLALANLSEAEEECVKDYPDLARRIRKARLEIEVGQFKGYLLDFIQEIVDIEKQQEKIKSQPF